MKNKEFLVGELYRLAKLEGDYTWYLRKNKDQERVDNRIGIPLMATNPQKEIYARSEEHTSELQSH